MKRKKKKNRLKREYSYGEFLILLPCCEKEHQEELIARLEEAECPRCFCGKEVPENLNAISYGMLDDLSNAARDNDPFVSVLRIILDADIVDVYNANVFDVYGICNFVKEEIKKINSLFAEIKVQYSSDEIQAGVKDLDFGSFGVLDWYARRMGITNQNDVRDVAWIRIYICTHAIHNRMNLTFHSPKTAVLVKCRIAHFLFI